MKSLTVRSLAVGISVFFLGVATTLVAQTLTDSA
jgi:hypothetical protein